MGLTIRFRLGRALAGGVLVFSLGLGIGALAGDLSTESSPSAGVEGEGSAGRRTAPPSHPATGEQRAEVPLYFVALRSDTGGSEASLPIGGHSGDIGSRELRNPPLPADGKPWML